LIWINQEFALLLGFADARSRRAGDEQHGGSNMVRPLSEILRTFGGYGFHIYDDSGARWITISYETNDAAKKARDLIARALIGAISARVHG
jgi:hypothetical protein